MDFLLKEQVSGKVLDHLGLVAVTMEKLGLIKKIDDKLPVSANKGSKVSMGQRAAAMILNGLGFLDDRLYMFPDFLANKPVDRLFGNTICAEYFNDDALGRLLDAIYDYGTTQLFTELAFAIGIENNLLGNSVHLDTSTISVYGDYNLEQMDKNNESEPTELNEENKSPINITYGYSKNKRYDLKQMVINLATTGAASFPIWMEAHSGNASDKAVLISSAERMKKFCEALESAPDFLYTGDSAFYENSVKHSGYNLSLEKPGLETVLEPRTLYLSYDKDKITFLLLNDKKDKVTTKELNKELFGEKHYNELIKALNSDNKKLNAGLEDIVFSILLPLGYNKLSGMKWLSRVPSTINEAKELLRKPENEFIWTERENGYHITPIFSSYGGVKQRWILVYSEHAYARESKTLDKQITKENNILDKKLRSLAKELFQCQEDAKKAAEACIEKIKYHEINFVISEAQKKQKKGQSQKNSEDNTIYYGVIGTVTINEEKIATSRLEKGRFILATNELDTNKLSDNHMLPTYKDQSKTESGFKFIKGNAFEVSSIFLKSPERIEALMMIMTLCLMVYSFAQYFLREVLEKSNETVPDQLKKPTKKPTMSWIFRMFHGVHLLSIKFTEYTQQLVINLTETTIRIVGFFGARAQYIYGLSESG
ncbi:MAG TPA: IS1634 family transposase [Bacteroidia bacterium]|nr:IS1634 family transposase [Bacteroidia bacterium]